MSSSPTDRIEAAIRSGSGRDFGLSVRHLERIEHASVDADGVVTFQLLRHAHILGRPSVGKPSTAYEECLETYRLIGNVIERVESNPVGTHVDVDALAAESVGQWAEGVSFERDFGVLLALRNPAQVRVAAGEAVREFSWDSDADNVSLDHLRDQYVDACIVHATNWVVREWELHFDSDDFSSDQ